MNSTTTEKQKVLRIKWQRLVDDSNSTCARCSDTEINLDQASNILRPLLEKQGIDIILLKKRILPLAFNQNPLDSNIIYIENKELESWLNAEIGKSQCCDVCGDNECRTLKLEGKTYEAIPVELIVRGITIAVESIFGIQIHI